ncbi:UNVERIFIED_CONTAM: hypothetical protein K2H54_038513 [Gekko kuhli]
MEMVLPYLRDYGRPTSNGSTGFYTPTGLTQQGARALQPQILPNPFSMYPSMPLMATGQLTQWGHFHSETTVETYLLTEGHRRDSRRDSQGQVMGQTLQGEATRDTSSVWMEPRQGGGTRTPPEEQMIVEEDNREEEEDLWATHLANLERGQHNIQRNLEEVMLTIPEIVIRTLHVEREVERQGREQQ